jgi:hypothetical protein
VTQGHYSKVVRQLVPPGKRLSDSIGAFLADQDIDAEAPSALAIRIGDLAANIQRQCIELMHLAEAQARADAPGRGA